MPIDTDLNVDPFYDDYDDQKNFHRVLFRPAVPVQARELTQLQTILQSQVERFGDFVFKEGTIIKGCFLTFESDVNYIKILDITTDGQPTNVASYADGSYLVNSNNLIGQIVSTSSGLESQNPDLNSIYFNYITTGDNGETTYVDNEVLTVYPETTSVNAVSIDAAGTGYANGDLVTLVSTDGSGFAATIGTDGAGAITGVTVSDYGSGYRLTDFPTVSISTSGGTSGALSVTLTPTKSVTIASNTLYGSISNAQFNTIGTSYRAIVTDGIIYQKGSFVRVDEQDVIVSKYTNRPDDLALGFETVETIVNNDIDTTLLDNAAGYNNENAPGAWRLKLAPTLVVNTVAQASISNNFLTIARFDRGFPSQVQQQAQLNQLGDELAARTFDESGNYVVRSFPIGTEAIAGNTTHRVVVVGAGKAYVSGYKFETLAPYRKPIRMGTDVLTTNNAVISQNFGNFVYVNELLGGFEFLTADTVLLTDTAFDGFTGAGNTGPNTAIGSANVISYGITSVTVVDGGANYDPTDTVAITGGGGSGATASLTVVANAITAVTITATGSGYTSQPTFTITTGAGTGADLKGIIQSQVKYNGANAEVIGTAKIRALEFESGKQGSLDGTYQMHLFDTRMYPGRAFADVKGIFHYAGNEGGIFADTNQDTRGIADVVLTQGRAQLQDSTFRSLLVPIAAYGVQTFTNANYRFTTSSNVTFLATGSATLDIGNTWPYAAAGYLNTTQEAEFVIIPKDGESANSLTTYAGMTITDGSPLIVGNTGITSDISEGDQIAINDGSNTIYRVVVAVSSSTVTVDQAISNNDIDPAASAVTIRRTFQPYIPINLRNRTDANVFIDDSNTATLSLGSTLTNSVNCIVVHDERNQTAAEHSKVLEDLYVKFHTSNCEAAVVSSLGGNNQTGPWTTGFPDVFELLGVYVNEANNTVWDESNDVTSDFELVRNETDQYYGLSYIQVKRTSSFTLSANATVLAKVRVFRTSTSSRGYYTVDSYPIDDVTTSNTTIRTEEVPVFVSSFDGKEYDLRNFIDFRPQVANTSAYTAGGGSVIATSTLNPSSTEAFDYGSGSQNFPAPNEEFTADIGNYVGRIDRLVITKDAKLDLIEGVAADNPEPPSSPDGSMSLAVIDVPPYPSLDMVSARTSGRPDEGIRVNTSQIRRYTMEDIAELEDRIQRLEYYTSLNLLEKRASDLTISSENDPTLSRFKNGILVDNFANFNISNLRNPEFSAGVDKGRDLLTPKFEQYKIELSPASTQNIVRRGDKMYLRYGSRRILAQNTATTSRTVASKYWKYNGSLDLFPDYDGFVETRFVPEAAINIPVDAASGVRSLVQQMNRIAPTMFTSSDVVRESENRRLASSVTTGLTTTETFETVRTITERTTTAMFGGQTRRTRQDVGDFVTDISFQPYIRAQAIRVRASGLRPNMVHYVFFDETDVSAQCRPAIDRDPTDSAGPLSTRNMRSRVRRNGALGAPLTSDDEGRLFFIFYLPDQTFFTGDRELLITDVNDYDLVGDSVSIASGDFRAFNFSVGKSNVTVDTRQFTPSVRTRSTNQTRREITNVETITETTVQANTSGGSEPVVNTSVGTTTPDTTPTANQFTAIAPAPIIPDFNIFEDFRFSFEGFRMGDPMAQTFTIQRAQTNGSDFAYVTEIELFFSQKNPNTGVVVEIRDSENGYPGQRIMPFGRVRLRASQVSTSTDGTVGTVFRFPAPVVLRTNKEYSFVVLPDANAPEYKLWVAKTGEVDTQTGQPYSSDWGNGVMFLSTNSKTWEPYLDEDVKFNIRSAVFLANTGQVVLENNDYEFFAVNAVTGTFRSGEEVHVDTANATGTISVSANSYAVTGAGTAFLTDVAADDKIVLVDNTGTSFDVVEVESVTNDTSLTLKDYPNFTDGTARFRTTPVGLVVIHDTANDKVQIEDSTAANGTFLFAAGDTLLSTVSGASATIETVEDNNISYYEPLIYRQAGVGTNVTLSVRAASDGGTNTALIDGKFKDRNYMYANAVVKSKSNEITDIAGRKSLGVVVNLSTVSADESPSLDLQTTALVVSENIINSLTTNEYLGQEGQSQAKYISRRVTLDNGLDAEDMRVYLTAYRPDGTDVKVFGRFLNESDPTEFERVHWTELELLTPSNTKSNPRNRNDYIEMEFQIPSTPATTQLAGSVETISGTNTISGNGTSFTVDLVAGDLIKIDNTSTGDYQVATVDTILSDTSLTITEPAAFTGADKVYGTLDAEALQTAFKNPYGIVQNAMNYYNNSGQKFETYKTFAIKIVLLSDNKYIVPAVKDYRAISLSV